VKANTHPVYQKVKGVCACGNEFWTRSTMDNIHVEICSQCHPFFTGKQRLVDTAGRVDRFMRRYQKTQASTTEA
jgi:large subunit ribosomal protein L31